MSNEIRSRQTSAYILRAVLILTLAGIAYEIRQPDHLPLQGPSIEPSAWRDLVRNSMNLESPGGEETDTVVMFTDYECIFCRRSHEVLLSTRGVRVLVRHLPLASLHPRATYGAFLALCGYRQGVGLGVHESLFDSQDWKRKTPEEVADDLGVADVRTFATCVTEEEPAEQLNEDADWARVLGVRGTPAFVSRGRVAFGALSPGRLRAFLER